MKRQIEIFKTTSHYLNYIKSNKTKKKEKQVNVLSSSFNSSFYNKGSNRSHISELNCSKINQLDNSSHKLLERINKDNNPINPIVEYNKNETYKAKLSGEVLDMNNHLLNHIPQQNVVVKPSINMLSSNNLPFLDHQKKESRLNEENEKRKLIEIVKFFDEFIETLYNFYDNFSNIKYNVYDILHRYKFHAKKVEVISKIIKKIEEKQEIIEANMIRVYSYKKIIQ